MGDDGDMARALLLSGPLGLDCRDLGITVHGTFILGREGREFIQFLGRRTQAS